MQRIPAWPVALGLAAIVQLALSAQPSTSIRYRPSLLVQLEVANLDASIAFYTTTLGFDMTERRDDLKFAHLSSNVPGLEIGLNEVAVPKVAGPILNFSVADVDEARHTLERAGVTFKGETVLIPGRVMLATFADPDGNRLRFAGPPKARR